MGWRERGAKFFVFVVGGVGGGVGLFLVDAAVFFAAFALSVIGGYGITGRAISSALYVMRLTILNMRVALVFSYSIVRSRQSRGLVPSSREISTIPTMLVTSRLLALSWTTRS